MARRLGPPRPCLLRAAGSLSPLVLTCEHASLRLPFAGRIVAGRGELLRSHWGWDIGAWTLTGEISRRLSAAAVGGRWSRLLIDLNRRVDDPTLIREEAGGVPLAWNRGLTAGEVERRVLAYHAPYHLEVDRLIVRRLLRGVRPLLIAVHSFTPVLDGRPRPFDVGVLYRRWRGAAERLGGSLREAGLEVRYNEPYSGRAGLMYAVERHGGHHALPCLELEINQDLLRSRSTGVARLGAVVALALAALVRDLAHGRSSAVPDRGLDATARRPSCQLTSTTARTAREKQKKKPTTKPWL